jgi:lambda repressor-like predicted transcriptional regulator
MSQHFLRKPVITEFRPLRHGGVMAKGNPSNRARAFKAWMAAVGTNTRQVAKKSEVPYTTLASFVQGDTQSLKGTNEELIASAFGVSVAEIFAGGGSGYTPIIGYVGADTEGAVIFSTGQSGDELVPIPPGGGAASRAVLVRGHSGGEWAPNGSIIYFEDQRQPPTPDMLGFPAVVETEDGQVLVKRLLKGSRPGVYDLESRVGPTLEDVRLKWAAEVTYVAQPKQARRIIRRTGEAA